MSWLERTAEREARRIGSRAGEITLHQVQSLMRRVADLADQVEHGRRGVRSASTNFARSAGDYAGEAVHQLGRLAQHETMNAARFAGHQTARAGRAFRADPMPAIVGIIGVAMLARLLTPRRRPATRS
jgi:hypothetical protein